MFKLEIRSVSNRLNRVVGNLPSKKVKLKVLGVLSTSLGVLSNGITGWDVSEGARLSSPLPPTQLAGSLYA